MTVLTLRVKGESFKQIREGIKKEEFRAVTPYWTKRLLDREYDKVAIIWGYPKKPDASRRLEFKWEPVALKTIKHKHFGPKAVDVYSISLWERIE